MRTHLLSSQNAQHGVRVDTVGDVGMNAVDASNLGGADFARRATATRAVRGAAGHGLHPGVNLFHDWNERCLRLQTRIGGVEALYMAQDDQHIGVYEVTYHGRQRVVIPKADFLDRYRIIFVDDGDHAVLQQSQQGVARIEVAHAGTQILVRQENLRDLLMKGAKQALIRPDEMALPNRCSRLLIDNRAWDALGTEHLDTEGDGL